MLYQLKLDIHHSFSSADAVSVPVQVSDVHVPRTRLECLASDHLPLIVEVKLPL